jgi:hypothetical protein
VFQATPFRVYLTSILITFTHLGMLFKWSDSFRLLNQNSECSSYVSHANLFRQSFPLWFNHINISGDKITRRWHCHFEYLPVKRSVPPDPDLMGTKWCCLGRTPGRREFACVNELVQLCITPVYKHTCILTYYKDFISTVTCLCNRKNS